jgi:alpha-L-fucosidase
MRETVRPTPGQFSWQRDRSLALFCHFGVNTFNGVEWSDGTLSPTSFDPGDLDCRQWAGVAKAAGASHIILTAKHHDGFCLWPTSTTDYSVASSPWKDGSGDVVAELASACREFDLGLGLYCSPWDRHQASWSEDPATYDALYLRQLEELCTRYGPLVEIWFDGAGSANHPYDWDAIMNLVESLQPDAMIFNMGRPTIRWIGNEDGLASDPCWYTVSYHVDPAASSNSIDSNHYLPPECDVSIRRNWFWQPDDADTLKSLEHLLAIWYRSIGLGANLLLNIAPNRQGRLDAADVARLEELTAEIGRRFANPIPAELQHNGSTIIATFPDDVEIDHLRLIEDIEEGQRIASHRIIAGEDVLVTDVHTVGIRRIHAFPRIRTRTLTIETDHPAPRLKSVEGFRTGFERLPHLPSAEQPTST